MNPVIAQVRFHETKPRTLEWTLLGIGLFLLAVFILVLLYFKNERVRKAIKPRVDEAWLLLTQRRGKLLLAGLVLGMASWVVLGTGLLFSVKMPGIPHGGGGEYPNFIGILLVMGFSTIMGIVLSVSGVVCSVKAYRLAEESAMAAHLSVLGVLIGCLYFLGPFAILLFTAL